MPYHALDLRGQTAALTARLQRLRTELELPGEFPAEVLEQAREAGRRVLDGLAAEQASGAREDATDVPFVTVDPEGSTDLDQALHLSRDGDATVVRYAIADVPAFIELGSALDAEARRRGQTVYLPDGRVPLHPESLSEDAGSLLPEQDRPAYVWTLTLDAEGLLRQTRLVRAVIRSRAQLTYAGVQAFLDGAAPAGPFADAQVADSLRLLPHVGGLRRRQEASRGGASLNMPDQEIHVDEDGYRLVSRVPLPVEDDNAHISLLTGMAAAQIMLDGGVGILRTMPAPEPAAVDAFRARARALGHAWDPDLDYGAFLRTLDPAVGVDLAVIHAATALFRGADYTVFDRDAEDPALRRPPEDPQQAAIAAPYAHATAPLRRLVDRFVLMLCHRLVTGAPVEPELRAALVDLPEQMRASGRRASGADRAAVELVEAAVLARHAGSVLTGTVVRRRDATAEVQLTDPPALVDVRTDAEPGTEVRVRLDRVDVADGAVEASPA